MGMQDVQQMKIDKDINRQKRELKILGCTQEENMYWEYESGTKVDRVELGKLLDKVVEGDTIVTTEVLRITRSTKQPCEIIDIVKEKQLKLVIGGFVVDCTKGQLDAMTDGMLKMMGVFAKYKSKQINKTELARLCDVSRQSIHKYIGIYEK